jgi:putative ABC transport system ATP-binding protein
MTLSVENLTYYYGNNPDDYLFKGVDESFEPGTLYAILGQSGSGKTTFLSLLAGLDTPKDGVIAYEGVSLKKIGLTAYRRGYVSTVFQAYNLLPYMTAYQNVETAASIAGVKVTREDIEETLGSVGLGEDLITKPVTQLSGGQQQRVAIARSLITSAKVLIADEPTGNLDEETTNEIIRLFQDIAHKQNKIVILVTHEKEVADASDVVFELKHKAFNRIKG